MKPIKYDKLVRDKMPEIIRADGWNPKMRLLTDTEHRTALKAKLLEEVAEYIGSGQFGELADILEVVNCLSVVEHRISVYDLGMATAEKASARGSFMGGVFLEEIAETARA